MLVKRIFFTKFDILDEEKSWQISLDILYCNRVQFHFWPQRCDDDLFMPRHIPHWYVHYDIYGDLLWLHGKIIS